MALEGLHHTLKTKVRSWISSRKDRFDTLEQLFNCAVASQVKPDNKTPWGQHLQWLAWESQKGGNKKCNFRPSISQPAENTSSNSNNYNSTSNSKLGKSCKPSGGSCGSLSSVPWLSKKVYQGRKAYWQCTRCGSRNYNIYLCTNYGKSDPPDQNSSNNSDYDGNQIKRQKSFDMQHLTTTLPLSISNSTEEAGQYGVRIGELGKLIHICNLE